MNSLIKKNLFDEEFLRIKICVTLTSIKLLAFLQVFGLSTIHVTRAAVKCRITTIPIISIRVVLGFHNLNPLNYHKL